MKITVINGTEKRGVTYNLKELFLQDFRDKAEITEFYLPKDMPNFCVGCTNCILKGEQYCRDYAYISPIMESLEKADLIVLTSPSYVMHATGAMKAFLDHMAVRWLSHRPKPEMFSKRAVIITQCLGAGAKSTASDMKDSLSWWGISDIKVFAERLMCEIQWDKIKEKKRNKLIKKINRLSKKCANINFEKSARTKLITKIKFYFCRMLQRSLVKNNSDSLDCRYWEQQGFLGKNRPWKKRK